LPPQWPGPPGHVRGWPGLPLTQGRAPPVPIKEPTEDDYFPEVVRAVGSRHAHEVRTTLVPAAAGEKEEDEGEDNPRADASVPPVIANRETEGGDGAHWHSDEETRSTHTDQTGKNTIGQALQ